MQEYWPALLPLVIGLIAFAVGMPFALHERNTLKSRKVNSLQREQIQNDPDKTG